MKRTVLEKTEAKRFRVFNVEEYSIAFRSNNLGEVVGFLKEFWIDADRSLYDFAIDCTVDDIEVNWADLMESIDQGEDYQDLQAF